MSTAQAIPSPTLYYVPSSRNCQSAGAPHYYTVVEQAGQPYRCECPAGQHGRRCWHVEAVIAGMVSPARPRVRTEACALCGRTDQRLIGSAGYMGTALDAKICRDYTGCADNRPWDASQLFR